MKLAGTETAMHAIRWTLGRLWDGRVWQIEHAKLLRHQLGDRNGVPRMTGRVRTDREHLEAAAGWLAAAQDAVGDGGVSGRYHLRTGWTSSYPETTGYIVPTFLALAKELDGRFHRRAARAIDFLLGVQLPDGAFPGGEVDENLTKPSVFNTAQILHGLTAWHGATGSPRVLAAARRAADWLVAMQDRDGAWRRHVYLDVATTYTAHASCWLAQFGNAIGDRTYLLAAERHLDWVLLHRDSTTGWIDLAGFTSADHETRRALTHTIAYTLWGVLFTSLILQRTDGLDAVRQAAVAVAHRQKLSGWLPGVLDFRWEPSASYACLTGNAQMALIWLHLFELEGDQRLLEAALEALDVIKAAQPLSSRNPGIRGGVAGSDPVWGDYLYMAFPNWAAMFFIDALIAKQKVLSSWRRPQHAR